MLLGPSYTQLLSSAQLLHLLLIRGCAHVLLLDGCMVGNVTNSRHGHIMAMFATIVVAQRDVVNSHVVDCVAIQRQ